MRRAPVVSAAVLLLLGCHRLLPGGERCSAHGGPEWREYRSRHFVVDTDLDRSAAATLVRDLERIQALVTTALTGVSGEIPGYVRVVAPARPETFAEIAPYGALAWFAIGDLGEPTIVVHPATLRKDPEVLAHELAHHWTWYFFPRQPLWFTEGVAQFVQTVASETPGYRNSVGVVPRVRAGALRLADTVPSRALLSWTGGGNSGLYELWSWVLYHWLWNQRPKQLAEFQRRLGIGEDPAAAWRSAFPEFDPDDAAALRKLDAALDEHRRSGELVYYQVSAEADGAFTDAPLSPADVHVLFASTDRELTAALADDPLQPVALYRRLPRKGDAGPLRAAAAARPGDWRAWYLLGVQIDDDGPDATEREAAYRKAIELNPRSASAQNALAWSLVVRGRAEEALPYARRAVELAPSNAAILDTLAKVAADLAACDEAVTLQRRAVALRPRDGELRGHLREIETRCVTR